MKRIRAVWIHLVARVVHHGRQITVVLGTAGALLVAARRRANLATAGPTRTRLIPAHRTATQNRQDAGGSRTTAWSRRGSLHP